MAQVELSASQWCHESRRAYTFAADETGLTPLLLVACFIEGGVCRATDSELAAIPHIAGSIGATGLIQIAQREVGVGTAAWTENQDRKRNKPAGV